MILKGELVHGETLASKMTLTGYKAKGTHYQEQQALVPITRLILQMERICSLKPPLQGV